MNKETMEKLAEETKAFLSLLELQFIQSNDQIQDCLAEIMDKVQELSQKAEEKAKSAEDSLEQTYLNPEQNTIDLVNTIQGMVDDVIEQALNGKSCEIKEKEQLIERNERLQRFGGLFSKHMESLVMLDNVLKDELIHVAGVLSADDLIRSRITAMCKATQSVKGELTKLMAKANFTTADVQSFEKDILQVLGKAFTRKEDKKRLEESFKKVA